MVNINDSSAIFCCAVIMVMVMVMVTMVMAVVTVQPVLVMNTRL